MTKYFMILAALFALIACEGDDGDDSWKTYAGLEWSPLSTVIELQDALDYCAAMGARLPNINELRKIIINCPSSTYGGACQVSDPDCLGRKDCQSEVCWCDGSADSYSALGDGKVWLWSSSSDADNTNQAWSVNFAYGAVNFFDKYSNCRTRCVR